MKCPYCGEEINNNAKKCRFCHEWLNKYSQIVCPACAEQIPADVNKCPACGEILQKGKHSLQRYIKIFGLFFILAFAFCSLTLGYNLYFAQYRVNEVPYKSIEYVESPDWFEKNLSAHEIIKLIERQENEFKEYLNEGHSVKENTGVFRLYYKNLKYLTEALNNKIELYHDGISEEGVYTILKILFDNGIKGKPIVYKKADVSYGIDSYRINGKPVYKDANYYYGIDYYEIVEPNIRTLEILFEGEGFLGFHINDSYISDSYAEYLNKSWQDYINNKKRIYDDLGHSNYFSDGVIIPDSITVAKWAIMWDEFLKKYPNFELKEEIKQDIETYSSDVLYRKYSFGYDEAEKKTILQKDIREGCEYFLKHANKNTEIYKRIKKDYKILEDNNFEYNDNTSNI